MRVIPQPHKSNSPASPQALWTRAHGRLISSRQKIVSLLGQRVESDSMNWPQARAIEDRGAQATFLPMHRLSTSTVIEWDSNHMTKTCQGVKRNGVKMVEPGISREQAEMERFGLFSPDAAPLASFGKPGN
jgi:hypothetical protein